MYLQTGSWRLCMNTSPPPAARESNSLHVEFALFHIRRNVCARDSRLDADFLLSFPCRPLCHSGCVSTHARANVCVNECSHNCIKSSLHLPFSILYAVGISFLYSLPHLLPILGFLYPTSLPSDKPSQFRSS